MHQHVFYVSDLVICDSFETVFVLLGVFIYRFLIWLVDHNVTNSVPIRYILPFCHANHLPDAVGCSDEQRSGLIITNSQLFLDMKTTSGRQKDGDILNIHDKLFCLLLSCRRYRSMLSRTTRFRDSFISQALRLLNSWGLELITVTSLAPY